MYNRALRSCVVIRSKFDSFLFPPSSFNDDCAVTCSKLFGMKNAGRLLRQASEKTRGGAPAVMIAYTDSSVSCGTICSSTALGPTSASRELEKFNFFSSMSERCSELYEFPKFTSRVAGTDNSDISDRGLEES